MSSRIVKHCPRKKPLSKNNHPLIYVTLYPILKEIAYNYGYALGLHGSVQRDFDIIAVPWIQRPRSYKKMLKEFAKEIGWTFDWSFSPTKKPHGRLAFTLLCQDNYHGENAYLDIGIMLTDKQRKQNK